MAAPRDRPHPSDATLVEESDPMRWRGSRRGFFEGPPRVLYHRTGARYLDALAAVAVLNGVVVAAFGLLVIVLYVDLHADELALFAACSAFAYAVESVVAGVYLRRAGEPVRAWLAGERGDE